jgi:predicted nuclease of predicted toxin-antitoxin system
MKLLFDQNLSPRLARQLAAEFPGSEHVRRVGLGSAEDSEIWRFAADHGFVIVSKDIDFQQRALLYGGPPKVVWVRLGNCSTASIANLLIARLPELTAFEADPSESFVVLS